MRYHKIPLLICSIFLSLNVKFNYFFNTNEITNNEPLLENQLSLACKDSEISFYKEHSFSFITNQHISKVEFSDIKYIKDYEIKENEVIISIFNIDGDIELNISFYDNNENCSSKILYFSKNMDNLIFSSTISLDTAKRNAGKSCGYNLVDESSDNLLNNRLNTINNGIDDDFDTYSCNKDDACEETIAQVLYKLNSNDVDSFDKFSISQSELWRIVTSYHLTSFSSFINALYNEDYNELDLGLLLSIYNITSNNIYVSYNGAYNCPTFSFSNYRGSQYLKYDEFEIYIYNDDFDMIHWDNTDFIYYNNNTYLYTINLTYRLTILEEIDEYYYVSIFEKQGLSYATGNYYSAPIRFLK